MPYPLRGYNVQVGSDAEIQYDRLDWRSISRSHNTHPET